MGKGSRGEWDTVGEGSEEWDMCWWEEVGTHKGVDG